LLEPAARLRHAAVRFDALAVDNRRGRRHLLQRLLQRRLIRRAGLLLPFSGPAHWPPQVRAHHRAPITLPTPVQAHSDSPSREPVAVCYAGAPEKKRLDLIMRAWSLAEVPCELVVTGISAVEGRAWLRRRGIREPPGVTWRGHLDAGEYRRLTSRAEIYLAASRYEDYGIAQLEALADGALLVTTASEGPYEALALARSLAPALVAERPTAAALAQALGAAAAMDPVARAAYRERAGQLLGPYSPARFRRRLADEVLPVLLSS
jgi:glycosyltransferase involved in cell wall biosynthesis